MIKYGILDTIKEGYNAGRSSTTITVGIVVDSNDPQQMGRLRVVCAEMGDTDTKEVSNVPWAMYASPFAGVSSAEKRGPEESPSNGPVAYGFWNIPKVGSRVLVACIDGNTKMRVWLGCLHGLMLTHTLPHGRFITGTDATKDFGITGQPSGPMTSSQTPIKPLYSNAIKSYTKSESLVKNTPKEYNKNYEWSSRFADYSVAKVNPEESKDIEIISKVKDDDKNGYPVSRSEPLATNNATGKNYDSSVYSWTSPGFHSISMDDNPENCRIRIRSTCGSQIIIDDTNERIYVSSGEGNNWVEMDYKGNIDIYSSRSISMRCDKDFNITAGENIRMCAGHGISMTAMKDFKLTAKEDIHVKTLENIRVESGMDILMEATESMHIKAIEQVKISSGSHCNLLAGGIMKISASDDLGIGTDAVVKISGSVIHLNGPPAPAAQMAESPNPILADFTSRVPEHEPWARVCMVSKDKDDKVVGKNGPTWTPEFEYTDPNVGKVEWGENIQRNPKWKR